MFFPRVFGVLPVSVSLSAVFLWLHCYDWLNVVHSFSRCENCRTKLRSYKGLLTHLHTCSKVPRGKTKLPEPAPPGPAGAPTANLSPMAMDQDPPRLESMSTPQQLPPQIQNADSSLPAAAQQDTVAPPHLGPPFLPEPDPSPPQLVPQQLSMASSLPQLMNETSEVPPSLNLEGDAKVPEPPEAQYQIHRGSQESPHPTPASAPQSVVPSAVWKKNQGGLPGNNVNMK